MNVIYFVTSYPVNTPALASWILPDHFTPISKSLGFTATDKFFRVIFSVTEKHLFIHEALLSLFLPSRCRSLFSHLQLFSSSLNRSTLFQEMQ